MVSVSLFPPDSLPWRVQVQGELAPQQLQRLRVPGLQRILHSTEQAWPREEGQQSHNCHDCDALPTPNLTRQMGNNKTYLHMWIISQVTQIHIGTNTKDNEDCKSKKQLYLTVFIQTLYVYLGSLLCFRDFRKCHSVLLWWVLPFCDLKGDEEVWFVPFCLMGACWSWLCTCPDSGRPFGYLGKQNGDLVISQ